MSNFLLALAARHRRWWALIGLSVALPGCHLPADERFPGGRGTRNGPGTFAAGGQQSVRIAANGGLWVAGDNNAGQQGLDSTILQRATWSQIGHDTGWAQVATGGQHILALHTDGRLFAWGDNSYGQLGPGTPVGDRAHPQLVLVPGHYAQLAAGYSFSLALTSSGQLYAWGEDRSGQLGPGRRATRPMFPDPHSPDATPVRVPGQWAHVAAGSSHVLALTPGGRLFAWGSNLRGELGPNAPIDDAPHPQPVPVPGHFSQVAAGLSFSLALTPEGQLYAWGDNLHGQLATPANSWQTTQLQKPPAMPTPRLVPGHWASVAAGEGFVLALRADGQLWAWGENSYGQIGRSPNEDSPVPAPLPGHYVRMSTSGQDCLALGTDGQLYAWGSNGTGQLGNDTEQSYFNDEPYPVPTVTP